MNFIAYVGAVHKVLHKQPNVLIIEIFDMELDFLNQDVTRLSIFMQVNVTIKY